MSGHARRSGGRRRGSAWVCISAKDSSRRTAATSGPRACRATSRRFTSAFRSTAHRCPSIPRPSPRQSARPRVRLIAGRRSVVSRRVFAPCLAILMSAVWVAPSASARAQRESVDAGSSADAAVLKKYCITCHSDARRTGGLSLEHADLADVPKGAETWEKVIRKLRVGMMPPPGMPKPPREQLDTVTAHLETALDRAAVETPHPGRTAMHRLNRAEYANAIRDLLVLDIDAAALLPPDD